MTCNLFTTCIFFCPNLPCDSLNKPLNCAPLPLIKLKNLHGKGDLNGKRMEISLHTVLFLLLLYFQVRCKATLEVMRHAMIPWSESVEKLVSEFMAAYPK